MVHSFPTRRSSDLSPWMLEAAVRARGHGEPLRHHGDRSEEHTSELQSHHPISYAVFCLKKKTNSGFSRTGPIIASQPASASLVPHINLKSSRAAFFFFNDTATTEIYTGWYTLSLHDALPI